MADYSSKYLFEARAVGVEKSANQLNKLAAALNNLSAASSSARAAGVGGTVTSAAGTGTGTGTGTGAGTTASKSAKTASSYDPNSYFPTGQQIARALSYSAAIAGAYAVMGLVVGTTERWVEAQVEFNRVLIDTQNTLGETTQDVADFADKIRYLSYLSGEAFSESSLVARREEILGRPGMGVAAAGLNVVFGESLDLSTAAEDITAIQTQFGSSFGDINDTLLALVQTSGITADELMSMSETWGALTDDLKLGGRNVDTMREIGALMASMSVVMGESGTVIETFLRKLERIYTDPAVGNALEGIGVSVRDASGEFRSLIDILDEISARGLGDEAYNALQEFFPNQLGQKSKQQLREFFNQIDLITGIVDDAVKSTANFDEALVRANSSLDVLGERLDASFDNWLSAVGDLSSASSVLANLSATFQNSATRLGPGQGVGEAGWNFLVEKDKGTGLGALQNTVAIEEQLSAIMERLIPGTGDVTGQRAKSFVTALPADFFEGITGAIAQRQYLGTATEEFQRSPYYNEKADLQVMIQDFILFMSMYRDQVDKVFNFTGIEESNKRTVDAQRRNIDATNEAAASLPIFTNAVLVAAGEIYNAAALSQVFTPSFYDKLNASPDSRVDREELAERKDSYRPDSYAAGYDALRAGYGDDRGKGIDALNEMIEKGDYDAYQEQRALAERLGRQQESDWDSLMNSMESSWDSMVSSLLTPTQVTAGDVELSKVGAYQDKWDEPLRQFRADINHLIKGEPEQYGSMERFADYIDPTLLATAMGADQETKDALFRGIEDIVADKYLSLQMPAEMYNKDALISSARDWIAGEQQSKETRATMEGWLTEAGIDSEFAKMFLDDAETPAIVKAMTGGWSPEQIQDEIGSSVPDIAGIVGDQFVETDWAGMFANSVEASVTNDYQKLVGAGSLLAKPIVEGAGDTIVDTLVPRIIEAVAHYYD